ncbi:autotransporter domain-containing protein [Sneathiella aquimaris]|uniref:autotransporter domain-containing protein n=1 Tax=Sneathiella aquimaris TaxID=2599305 RepID=UPI00146F7A54|nr:autotransporter domain-containing protein [Sneathiella aquimaris]
MLYLMLVTASEVQAFQIFVNVFDTKTITLDVNATDSIDIVRGKVQAKEGYTPDQQKLTFGGTTLVDGQTLQDYGIAKEDTLRLDLIDTNAGQEARQDKQEQAVTQAASNTQIAFNVKTVRYRFQKFNAGGGFTRTVAPGVPTTPANSGRNSPFQAVDFNDPFRSESRALSPVDFARMMSFDTSEISLALGGGDGSAGDPFNRSGQRGRLLSSQPLTIWGQGGYLSLENDRNNVTEDNRLNGHVWGYNLGMDYRLSDAWLTGVAVGYTITDVETEFNNGTYQEDTFSVLPYLMYKPSENFSVSSVLGYSIGQVERTKDTSDTGNADSESWFANIRGSYQHRFDGGPLTIKGKLEFEVGRKTVDAFTYSDNTANEKSVSDTQRVSPGVELAYGFALDSLQVEPFGGLEYIYDFGDAVNDDVDAYTLSAGLRLNATEQGLAGSVIAEKTLGRNDYDEYSISGLISYGVPIGNWRGEKKGMVSPFVKFDFSAEEGAFVNSGLAFKNASGNLSAELNMGQSSQNTFASVGLSLTF